MFRCNQYVGGGGGARDMNEREGGNFKNFRQGGEDSRKFSTYSWAVAEGGLIGGSEKKGVPMV